MSAEAPEGNSQGYIDRQSVHKDATLLSLGQIMSTQEDNMEGSSRARDSVYDCVATGDRAKTWMATGNHHQDETFEPSRSLAYSPTL